jgi:AmiR/NasT family two-component response regulator
VIERAKGIIMSREEVDEDRAFERLRSESQRSGHRVYDVAQAVISSHLVLVRPERQS